MVKKIVIADDEPEITELLTQAFEFAGYQPVSVSRKRFGNNDHRSEDI